jgi:hypothetical protein
LGSANGTATLVSTGAQYEVSPTIALTLCSLYNKRSCRKHLLLCTLLI